MKSETTFTKVDHLILESYKQVIEGLGDYLGTGYEIVLHNLESYTHSVIAIHNGHYTGRKIGAPITNMALDMLKSIKESGTSDHISYFTTNRDGKPMKSTTIAIRGEKHKIIGLICINFYMDIPFSTLLQQFNIQTPDSPASASNVSQPAPLNTVTEEFSENSSDLIYYLINSSKDEVYADYTIPSANKNKVIIQTLYEKGIFNFKDAVQIVAKSLNISKNTVYLHLRNANKKETIVQKTTD